MTVNRLPPGYTVRPATLQDVPQVVETLNAASRAIMGVEKHNPTDLANEWGDPGFEPERDTLLVYDPDGRLVGYQEVYDPSDPHVRIGTWGQVHPDYTGCGIGSYLLEWAEQRARSAIPKAPPEAQVLLDAFILTIHPKAIELYNHNGFDVVRYNLRMVIDLNGHPAEPVWPEGISVRPMVLGQDERAIVTAIRESFRDHWGFVERPFDADLAHFEHRKQEKDYFDPDLQFIAWDGDQVAGISLCLPKWFDDPELGWVSTLGVLRPWRRRGLGLALLQHSFQELYRRGQRRVGLGVDASSLTGATQLYLKAGMQSDPNRQFALLHKVLRPGKDLSTQTVE